MGRAHRAPPHRGPGDRRGGRPVEISGLLLRGRATPTPRQLAEVGEVGVDTGRVREVTAVEFLHTVRDEAYDVVVLALVGGAVQAMLHGLAALELPRRPVVVTGYVGVVYEKLADGLLLRHGADVVLANSRHDARAFPRGLRRGRRRRLGRHRGGPALPRRRAAPGRRRAATPSCSPPSPPYRRPAPTVRTCCAGSSSTPGCTPAARCCSSCAPSRASTPRTSRSCPTSGSRSGCPAACPPNFRLVYGHMGEVLDRTDLLVTVSSTAALESLHRRHPDRDPHRPRRPRAPRQPPLHRLRAASPPGTTSTAGYRPRARPGVARRPGRRRRRLVRRRLRHRPRPGRRAARRRAAPAASPPTTRPPPPPATSPASSPATTWAPTATRCRAPSRPRRRAGSAARSRDTVRNAARGAYRHGVQRVAPVIRRMGEL